MSYLLLRVLFVVLNTLFISDSVFSQCPSSPSVRNGQGGNECHPSDNPPSGYTVSGSWRFSSGPSSNMSIFEVYRDGTLYQSGSSVPVGNADIWWGSYYVGTYKNICFYTRNPSVNTPASAEWRIIFSSSSGQQCTFTVSSGGAVTLPVTWETISAQKQNSQVLINWSTASEQNTKDFEVQYSTNTTNWDALATVQAAGNTTSTRNYSFTHQSPLKNNTYNYYRILQRDLDGKFSYSKIVSIVFDEQGPDFLVYPNPADKLATIYLSESSEVSLINSAGGVVWRAKLPAGRNQLPLEKFNSGVYIMRAGKSSQRLVIQ